VRKRCDDEQSCARLPDAQVVLAVGVHLGPHAAEELLRVLRGLSLASREGRKPVIPPPSPPPTVHAQRQTTGAKGGVVRGGLPAGRIARTLSLSHWSHASRPLKSSPPCAAHIGLSVLQSPCVTWFTHAAAASPPYAWPYHLNASRRRHPTLRSRLASLAGATGGKGQWWWAGCESRVVWS